MFGGRKQCHAVIIYLSCRHLLFFSLVTLNQLMFLLVFNDNTSERRKSVSWVETKACAFFKPYLRYHGTVSCKTDLQVFDMGHIAS